MVRKTGGKATEEEHRGQVDMQQNYDWVGRWCGNTTMGRAGDGAGKLQLGGQATVRENHSGVGGRWCGKTTTGQAGDGTKNHSGVGGWWCENTTTGQVDDGVRNYDWAGGQWCDKTTAKWAGDGVRTP